MIGKLVYSEDKWFVEYQVVTTKGKITKELPIHPTENTYNFKDGDRVSFDIEFDITINKINRYARIY